MKLNKLWNIEDNFTITKAAIIVGFFTLVTKFLAIYRERLFGETFGQDRILDTYFSAFRIPDFLTNLLILSTLSVVFLPVFSGLLATDKKRAMAVVNIVLNWTVIGVGFISLVLFLFSRPLVHILVPGFSAEYFNTTLRLTRLFLISPVIFAASTVFGGFLNANKKFLAASFAPILYNLGIIFGVIFLYPKYGIMGLGYGVIFGALTQLFIQLLFAKRGGYIWLPALNIRNENVQKIIRLYLPRILSFDLSNVTLLLGTILGSFLLEGSIAALNQAYNLEAVPVGIFAYSLALAVFPPLSEFYATHNEEMFVSTLQKVLRQLFFFMIPITVLMLLYRAFIVRLILGFGKFDWNDTITTFSILGIFSFSLLTQSLTTVLSRAFFARQNTKTPVFINLTCIILNLVFGVLLGRVFGIYGLAAAFSLSSIINALLLFMNLRGDLEKNNRQADSLLTNFDAQLWNSLIRVLFASFLMGLTSYFLIYAVEPFVNTKTVVGILTQVAASGSMGFLVYIIAGHFLRLQESQIIMDFLEKFLYSFKNLAKIDNR